MLNDAKEVLLKEAKKHCCGTTKEKERKEKEKEFSTLNGIERYEEALALFLDRHFILSRSITM